MNTSSYHPSEIFKFCPKCGHETFAFLHNKYFECASCKFQFFINQSTATAAIIINEVGEIAMTTRKRDPYKGTLDLPGGFINVGESIEDGLIREVQEETNLHVVSYTYLFSLPNVYCYGGIEYFTADAIFLCKVMSFQNIQANDDVESVVFIKPQDIDLEKIGLPSMRKAVQQYISSYL